jgi:hypothetical protein
MNTSKTSHRRRTVLSWVLGLVGLGTLSTAYIDPGSGSFIIQVLVASVLGGALLVRTFWAQVTGLFKRKPAPPDEPKPPSEPAS